MVSEKMNALIQERTQEAKAITNGKLDAFLVGLFALLATLAVQLLEWLLTQGLDLLDGVVTWSLWPFAKGLIILLGTMVLKGLDRKKHEDPSTSTGLVKL